MHRSQTETLVRAGAFAWLVLPLALATAAAAHAEDAASQLAGPVLLGPAAVEFGTASYGVTFGEGGRTVHVELALPLTSAAGGDVALGFAVRGVWRVSAELDGVPVPVGPAAAFPLAGGPFDEQLAIGVTLVPGATQTLVVRALGDTVGEEREAQLTYPQATFLLNRLLDAPRARVVELRPGPALVDLHMRVETVPPQWPEAPVAGELLEAGGRYVLEGPVVADLAVPLQVSAIEGQYDQPRNWGVIFGIGAGIDWPRSWGTRRDPVSGAVTGHYFYTPDFGDPASRVWFRGLFAYAFHPHWRFETGVEGDFAGALEIPFTFTWFPQEGYPEFFDLFGDYHFIFGLAAQLINNRMPEDHGFDPRPFLRLGVGARFLLVTLDVVYEIAPPLGDWDGRWGGLEHKLLITFPFAF